MTILAPAPSAESAAAPSSFRFSTDQLPAHERVPVWVDVVGRNLLNVEVDVFGDVPFRCEAAFHKLPGLNFLSANTNGGRGSHTRELIARRSDEEVMFTVSVRGAMHTTWLASEMSAAEGEAVLVPTDEPASIDWPEPSSVLMYGVPTALLKPLVRNVGDSLLRIVPQSSEALRLLVGYTGLMLRPDANPAPEIRHAAAAHIRDLIALALGATRDAAAMAEQGGLRAARLQAIKAEVTRNAASPELNIGTVARRHRVSPRSVQMLFDADGTTFSQFVLEQRLMLAHRALASWPGRRRSVTDIALDSGFSDVSYFNRAFRRRFGASPTEIRARHVN